MPREHLTDFCGLGLCLGIDSKNVKLYLSIMHFVCYSTAICLSWSWFIGKVLDLVLPLLVLTPRQFTSSGGSSISLYL